MVIMSRDVTDRVAGRYQCAAAGRPRAATPTRYGTRHNGQSVEPLPLSLPAEDTYLLRSDVDKKNVVVYIDDDVRIREKLSSTSQAPSVVVHSRSTSFCLIPPTPPPHNGKKPSKARQISLDSAPAIVRVGASLDLSSPSAVDGHSDDVTNEVSPLTPDHTGRSLPPSTSCTRRGFYWAAAVSDASETSDQPPSNWASFDLSFSDCPLRLPPSDTNCDLTIASVDSPTPGMSDSVAALSVQEFDPLSCQPTTGVEQSTASLADDDATAARTTTWCPSPSMHAFRSLGNVIDGDCINRTHADLHSWAMARRLPPSPQSSGLLGRKVRKASASVGNDGARLLVAPSASSLSPLDDQTVSVTAICGDESIAASPTSTVSGRTRSTTSTLQTSRRSSRKDRRRATPTVQSGSQIDDEHNCRTSGCRRIRINVSGQRFETRLRVLDRHPLTLLGNVVRRRQFYDIERRELFFDRHRPSFEAIFAYYQTGGRLRRPYHVADDIFLAELEFYELEHEAIEEYKRSEGHIFEVTPMPSNPCLRKVWELFEHPDTSRCAFCIAILSVVMTLVSIVLFCVETLPTFAETHCVGDEAPNFLDPFFIIETTCTAWFTLEAIVRFIACPSKIDFWKDFKNIVDVMAVVPYYVTLFNVLSTMSCASAKSSASLSFLRVIRLVRVFKLTKHSVGLQVLVLTFKASLEGLGLFLVALFVSLLVFSSAIYYAELDRDDKSQMKSIPDAFWWAIITMTTVGYGDKVPIGPMGRLIGAACAITGVLTLAIPVPIITGHFNRFYAHKTGRGRHV